MYDFLSEHEKYMEINEAQIRYIDIGNGPCLLFLHGLSGRLDNWQYSINALSDLFRVIALDLPYHGKTTGFSSVDPCEAVFLSTLKQLIMKLEIANFHLIGNSFGGLLSILLYFEMINYVESIILISSVGLKSKKINTPISTIVQYLKNKMNKKEDILFYKKDKEEIILSLKNNVFYNPSLIPDFLVMNSLEVEKFPKRKKKYYQIQKKLFKIRPNIRRIDCPTLIIWGKNDKVISYHDAFYAFNETPNSSLIIFNNCGHLPFIEKHELFNKIILNYLHNP